MSQPLTEAEKRFQNLRKAESLTTDDSGLTDKEYDILGLAVFVWFSGVAGIVALLALGVLEL